LTEPSQADQDGRAVRHDAPDSTDSGAWLSGPPVGSGPPGSRVFSLENRAAPGLYLVSWLLSLAGVALLFVSLLTDPGTARAILALLATLALGAGIAAGAGYQVVARRDRTPSLYRGPSPVLAFLMVLMLSTILTVALELLGLDLSGEEPFGFLAGLLAVLVSYAAVVGFVVVRTGALSWHQMGWPTGWRPGRILEAIGLGMGAAIPGLLAVSIIGAVVSTLLGGIQAPDIVPAAQSTLEVAILVLGAVIVAPLGEELFFRGFALTAWLRDLGPWPALVRSAVFFGLVHIFDIRSDTFDEGLRQAILTISEIVPLAFLLGWLFLRRGIAASMAAHATFNGLVLALQLAAGGTLLLR
jgi:CAAX protease family protein